MSSSKITFTLNEVVNVINSLADGILRDQFDMTYSQFLFLVSLKNGAKSVTETAIWQGVSVAAVSKRIEWFKERKLVRTQPDPRHGRKILLSLTQKGTELLNKEMNALETQFRNTFIDVPGVDLNALNKDLNILLAHLHSCTENEKERNV